MWLVFLLCFNLAGNLPLSSAQGFVYVFAIIETLFSFNNRQLRQLKQSEVINVISLGKKLKQLAVK